MKRTVLATLAVCLAVAAVPARAADRPNVVYILADDLGYGDVKCLNPDGKIATPNLDRLAAAGMAFSDAHSGSAVCSPTRYGILTGRYAWRSPLKNGVLGGYSPRLIEEGRLTVAALLKQHGYHTACVGKWHLGLNWPLQDGGIARDYPDGWKVDYARPFRNGPTALGFDGYFGISASLDMPPYVFLENDRAVAVPTVEKTWIRKGPADKDFEAIDVLPTLTRKAVAYVDARAAAAKKGQPFFLYLALNTPHTPILPAGDWQGKSGLNAYADFVMQTDACVGEVLQALEKNGLADDTLVVFASDNGCSPSANFEELLAKGHNPNFRFRGHKADIYEGGHHIPLLARWPGHVKPGATSEQLVCLSDLMATCADLLGVKLPDDAGEDSVSLLPALLGRAKGPLHEAVVHHSSDGSFAIRQGRWKLALCPGSGGWSAPRPGRDDASKLPPVQLFDLADDPGEKVNVQDKQPETVARLTKLLEQYVADGRSTPGKPQKNTRQVDIWEAGRAAQQPPPKGKQAAAGEEAIFDPDAKLKVEAGDGAGGEGPVWHPKLGILSSGGGHIYQLDRDGKSRIYRKSAGTNGLLFDPKGRLIACESEARRITRTEADGTVTVLTDRFEGKRYNTPNDLTLDSQGRVYFSDPRYGDRKGMEILDDKGRTVEGVYRIDPDGKVTRVIGRELERPNGVLVSGDDHFLYVADNNNDTAGGARKLWRFDLRKDGTVDLESRKLMYDWGKGRGPDGLKQDQKGRLYVAAGLNKPNPPFEPAADVKGGIYVLSPEGKLLAFLPVPTDEVTNCAFGGDDLKTLYVTGGGTLYSIRTTTPGRVVYPPAE